MIDFSNEIKEELVSSIQNYFQDELSQEIGRFDAEFLLDFCIKEIGVYAYNQALRDVQTKLSQQLDTMTESIYELEKPLPKR